MKRDLLLAHLRSAGYHDDRATWTRLYVENRVSHTVAKVQFQNGAAMRAAGVPCTCSECKR